MQSELKKIAEDVRREMLNLETARERIKRLNANTRTHAKLKERLTEYSSTVLADLVILYDFLSEAGNCVDENDINLLL